jgi:hypothetical protein
VSVTTSDENERANVSSISAQWAAGRHGQRGEGTGAREGKPAVRGRLSAAASLSQEQQNRQAQAQQPTTSHRSVASRSETTSSNDIPLTPASASAKSGQDGRRQQSTQARPSTTRSVAHLPHTPKLEPHRLFDDLLLVLLPVLLSQPSSLQSTTGTTASTNRSTSVTRLRHISKTAAFPRRRDARQTVFLSLLTRAIKGRDITLKASSAPPIPQHGPHTQPPCA